MNGSDAVFAGYRLEQRIMTDTVSTVYRAISQSRSRQRRPVALRITEPLDTAAPDAAAGGQGSGEDAATVADFFTAVDDAAAISHPALATIHEVGKEDGWLYVATDLVAGVTLDRHIRQHGPLPAAAAVALLQPIAEALDRSHAAGVVHRAISPRTITVPRAGADQRAPAILTGFGLDTLLARRIRIDRTGVAVTDVCYVAPEQLGGGDTDARVDQYALACALYHCVSGRPPLVRDTVAATFGAHLFSEARVPAGRGGDGAFATAVLAGLARHPDDRHASCTALLRAAAPPTLRRAAATAPPLVPRRATASASASRPATRPAPPAMRR
ncbi:MAG TPA: protein kinase, partial [Euzebyales bacterium]|nr:protein kinase [Euzebyales bacterium]